MSLTSWLNTAWMLKCSSEAAAFRRATRHVPQTQADLLLAMIRQNDRTAFGRAHRFDRIRSPREYQDRVPLSVHADYAGYLERIALGEANVLTQDAVELLEPTSGTSRGEKLIPYTATLRRQFQRGIAAWIADLYWHRPGVRRGRAYWSISPAFGPSRRTHGGIPIGFEDDAAYLGGLERTALDRLLVVPSVVTRIPDPESFRYCTLLCLLRAGDLSLISIWNPTFLSALLAPLEQWAERLIVDLKQGTVHPPRPLPARVSELLCLRSDPKRAASLRAIFTSPSSLAEKLRRVWPNLALISCWTDAAAARSVPAVSALFPGIEIQPKGLLATEGFVTLPRTGKPGAALAVRSHFFEFVETGAPHHPRLSHELERGGRYRVILTTGGGLYRYQLRDEVEVVGFLNRCPLLRFLGKTDQVSDLVGEKLTEAHVAHILDRAFAAHRLTPCFALLVPVLEMSARYRLYVQGIDVELLDAVRESLQHGLEENPHYRYAVGVGQLAPAEVVVLASDGEPGWEVYERVCLRRGQRAGNIKPAALDPWTGWARAFRSLVRNPRSSTADRSRSPRASRAQNR